MGMERHIDIQIRTVALLLFLVAVFFYGWNCDDAYHSYIMARHLADGKGLVYNTGYRVTASTCPFLTLIQAAVFLFTNRADFCAGIVGLLFSGAAAWILFFRLCHSPAIVFLTLGVMISSRCFMSFTTSGLENPLLFFFGALFFDVYFCKETLSKRDLFTLALLMALLAWTRTDSALMFIPLAVWAYLARTKVLFVHRALLGVVGLLPFVLWTFFSVLYYGFPFPNTYYAKLYTGLPVSGYIERGLWYYLTSWLVDPMLLAVPFLAMLMAFKVKNQTMRFVPLMIGLVAYCLYVVSIGGDFMAGRHLTQQFFISVCTIAFLMRGDAAPNLPREESRFFSLSKVVMLELFAIGMFWDNCIAPQVNDGLVTLRDAMFTKRSAVDERDFYIRRRNDFPIGVSIFRGSGEMAFRNPYCRKRALDAHNRGAKGFCFGDHEERFGGRSSNQILSGYDIFVLSELDMYLTDVIALQDPLMARLKAETNSIWRVGHIVRPVPDGYHETLSSGENRICDPALHDYYDKLLLVMKGPLFDSERLRTIFGLNCGKYEGLLDRYEKNRILQQ